MLFPALTTVIYLMSSWNSNDALPAYGANSRDSIFGPGFEQTTRRSRPTTTIDYDLADFDEFGNDPGMYDVAGSPDAINLVDDNDQGFDYQPGLATGNSLFGSMYTIAPSVSKSPVNSGGISDEVQDNMELQREGGPSDEGVYTNTNQEQGVKDTQIFNSVKHNKQYMDADLDGNKQDTTGNDENSENRIPLTEATVPDIASLSSQRDVAVPQDSNENEKSEVINKSASDGSSLAVDSDAETQISSLQNQEGLVKKRNETSPSHENTFARPDLTTNDKKAGTGDIYAGLTETSQSVKDTSVNSIEAGISGESSYSVYDSNSQEYSVSSGSQSNERSDALYTHMEDISGVEIVSGEDMKNDNQNQAVTVKSNSMDSTDIGKKVRDSIESSQVDSFGSHTKESQSSSVKNGWQSHPSSLEENGSPSSSYKNSHSASDENNSHSTSDENNSHTTSDENNSHTTSDENNSHSTSDENNSHSISDENNSHTTSDENNSHSTSDENGLLQASDETALSSTSDENRSENTSGETGSHSYSSSDENSSKSSGRRDSQPLSSETIETSSTNHEIDNDYDIDHDADNDDDTSLTEFDVSTSIKASVEGKFPHQGAKPDSAGKGTSLSTENISGSTEGSGVTEIDSDPSNDLAKCFTSQEENGKYCYLLRSLYSLCRTQFKQECVSNSRDNRQSMSDKASVNSKSLNSLGALSETSSESMEESLPDSTDSITSGGSFSSSSREPGSMSIETVESISASFEKTSGIFEVIDLIRDACESICAIAESHTGNEPNSGNSGSDVDIDSSESSDDDDWIDLSNEAFTDSDEDQSRGMNYFQGTALANSPGNTYLKQDDDESSVSSKKYSVDNSSGGRSNDDSFVSVGSGESKNSADSIGGYSSPASENTSE